MMRLIRFLILQMEGPFPFTTEGIRKAFRLQESRYAHGKAVICVVEDTK